MTTCADQGFLVDGTAHVPTDPTDLHVDGLPVVGCSALRCGRCAQPVRSGAGLALATAAEVAPDALAALYAMPDLASSPLLVRGRAEHRLYLCRCTRWLETSHHACAAPDRDDSDPDVPWRCAGHPTLTWPHDLDGVVVSSAEDLPGLVVAGLHDQAPPRTRAADRERAEWIARLHSRVSRADAAAVTAGALACMTDASPRARALALRFFYLVPSAEARAQLVELLEQQPQLFADPDPVTTIEIDTTLAHTAWRILAPLVAADGPARERARAAALAGTANVAILGILARNDSAWFTTHGEDVARAAPHRVPDLLDSLYQVPDGVPTQALRGRLRALARP